MSAVLSDQMLRSWTRCIHNECAVVFFSAETRICNCCRNVEHPERQNGAGELKSTTEGIKLCERSRRREFANCAANASCKLVEATSGR
jgi:hypothetical protein